MEEYFLLFLFYLLLVLLFKLFSLYYFLINIMNYYCIIVCCYYYYYYYYYIYYYFTFTNNELRLKKTLRGLENGITTAEQGGKLHWLRNKLLGKEGGILYRNFNNMAEFDAGTLDAGGNLSEQRKLTLLRRQNMTTEELEAEEEEDEDFWAQVDLMKMSRLDLKLALQARGLSTKGTKKKLRQRLEQSIEEEKQEELEFLAMVEAARRAEAALEEGGSVYCTGDNRKGQLGLGGPGCPRSVYCFTYVEKQRYRAGILWTRFVPSFI